MIRPSLYLLALCVGAALLVSTQTPAAQSQPSSPPLPLPLRLDAFAVNMSNIGTGQTGTVDIRITNWSTTQERERVVTTMVDKGQDELVNLLQKLPSKGRLRFPNLPGRDPNNLRLGWDIRYAWTEPEPEGGHRIVVALDRVMSFFELRNRPRTVDYPFTLIEIHLNKDNEGEGKMAYATRITFDKKKNIVELENFSSEPVRLTTVKMTKG
jgi:hypothetical protein